MADNKKYDSDTLRQQRKAREEFLELKKIQAGETAAPPPPSAEAVLPKTFKEKSQNFWFYYRKAVFVIIFFVVAMAVIVAQCVSRVDYDLSVTLYTASPVSDADAKKMAEYFEQFCTDINGDGEVHIQVNNCSYSADGNVQYAQTANMKVQAIIAADYDAVLFVTDEATHEHLNSITDGEGFFETDEVLLKDDFYKFCDSDDLFPLPQDLQLSCHIISNTVMEKNKKAAACRREAMKIIQKISVQN